MGGGDFLCAVRDSDAGDCNDCKLEADLTVVVVVGTAPVVVVRATVVVGADTAGVTGVVVVVVVTVGEGITTPDDGNETTPIDRLRVGPLGWLWGTKMIPNIPIATNTRETAHHIFCGGRFSLRDFTSPNLVCLN